VVLLSAWLLAGCLKTAPLAPEMQTAMPAVETLAGPEIESTEAITVAATPQPGPAPVDSSPLFPGLDLAMQADLPAAPQAASLYGFPPELIASDATARTNALSFGVNGQPQGVSGSSAGFWVFDGVKRFWKSSSHKFFDLYLLPPMLLPGADCSAPCLPDGAASRVDRFLKDSNSFQFDYNLQPSPAVPHQVDIFQLLEGAPLISPYGPAVTILTDKYGAPLRVRGREVVVEPGRSLKLHSGTEAWQALKDGKAGVIFNEYPSGGPQARTWNRRYATIGNITIYGEAQVVQPVEQGEEALILLNDYIVRGAMKGLEQAAQGGRIIEAWGQVNEDGPNGPEIELSSWQASVFPAETFEGHLIHDGQETFLVTATTRFWLPAAPAEIAEGKWLTAHGIMPIAEIPTIDWWSLTEGPAQRVRSGGPGFMPLNLESGAADQSTRPTGPISGAAGIPQIIAHAYADGSSQVEVQFVFAADDGARTATRARLDGVGLQGIEAYHSLPVRIWGQAGETSGGLTVIEVERFEPLHPDVRVDAWLGMAEQAQAKGKPVWLITTPGGESFILASTLNGEWPGVEAALLHDPIIVEGVQIPGNTVLDFPIIDDLLILPGVGRSDMEGYQPVSAQPRVIHEPGAAGARRTAHIDKAELVYVLTTVDGQLADAVERAALAQPAWRFSGKFNDGSYFEIYVQALIEV